MPIRKGDIVSFKKIYKIGVEDLIGRRNFSKYMIVVDIINHVKPACKVMCANGEINWVSVDRIKKETK